MAAVIYARPRVIGDPLRVTVDNQHKPMFFPRFPSIVWQTLTDEIEFTEGMEIERGFISPYFVKNQEAVSLVVIHPSRARLLRVPLAIAQ